MANGKGLSRTLGLFSVGLGLLEVVAPGPLARFIGVGDSSSSRTLLRFYGVRELGVGALILMQASNAGWIWARVAGDVLDVSSLLLARGPKSASGQRLMTMVALLGVGALDVLCATQLSSKTDQTSGKVVDGRVQIKKVITVQRPASELYQMWHDFTNLPRFMRHLEEVQDLGNGRSHWKAKAPAGKTVEWDAEIAEDRPDELIAWRSLGGADVANAGRVTFRPAPGDRGTEVMVQMEYEAPGGKIGKAIAMVLGEEPEVQVQSSLRAFKQVVEAGELARSEASEGNRPARPPVGAAEQTLV